MAAFPRGSNDLAEVWELCEYAELAELLLECDVPALLADDGPYKDLAGTLSDKDLSGKSSPSEENPDTACAIADTDAGSCSGGETCQR